MASAAGKTIGRGLRLFFNVGSCSVVAPPMHAPSRNFLFPPSSFHTISLSFAFTTHSSTLASAHCTSRILSLFITTLCTFFVSLR